VVETNYGFHIFQRSELPAAAELSGAHIVIGHEHAQWLEVVARGPLPRRSREEALALARELYRQASADPNRFPDLVQQYSEDCDAAAGGDFGSWSTREPNPYPARMLRLQALRVGEVGPPVETNLGFELVRRTPPRQRADYEAHIVRIFFNPDAPAGDPSQRESVLAQAEAAARVLTRDPSRFDAEAERITRDKIVFFSHWQSARGDPSFTLQLERLPPGGVTPEPILLDTSFLVAQRVVPTPLPVAEIEFELPAPRAPELDRPAPFAQSTP